MHGERLQEIGVVRLQRLSTVPGHHAEHTEDFTGCV